MSAQKKKANIINLLPQSDFEATPAGRVLKWALTTFRMIVIAVELVVIVGFLSRFVLDMRNSDLDDEIEAKESLITSRALFEQEFRLITRKIATYSFMSDDSLKTAPLLARMVDKIPPDTELTSLARTDESITIRAASLSERSVLQMITNLRLEPELADIQITSIETNADSAFINFVLETIKEEDGS